MYSVRRQQYFPHTTLGVLVAVQCYNPRQYSFVLGMIEYWNCMVVAHKNQNIMPWMTGRK